MKAYTFFMNMFEHYMYVLECGDGSLYTGYASDVDARVEAHKSGNGAKYTKSHSPVKLIAKARFYSKERAMSAESNFKKLTRKQKDELLAMANSIPFEDILCEQIPNFGSDSAIEFVDRSLAKNVDTKYKVFQSKLIPNIDSRKIAGVRTPDIKRIAKELSKRDDNSVFLKALPHHLFDENQVHAFTIGMEKDYDRAIKLYETFLPYVDNWATCDQLPVKTLLKRPDETLSKSLEWIGSDHCYTIRFSIGVLMRLFLDEMFEERFLKIVANASMPVTQEKPASDDDIYYVNMMRAWYFAEALTKQQDAALPYLERKGDDALLDEWTRRKGIQKAVESRRISDGMKDHLRKCK